METKKPTVEERQVAWELFTEAERSLLLNKGADYTAGQKDADAYANFRIIFRLLKGAPITPFTVAMVYFLKHILSVITFTISGKQESGEPLEGRFHDIRNYAFILNELVPDHMQAFDAEMRVFGGTLPLKEWPIDPNFPYTVNAKGEAVINAAEKAAIEAANAEFDKYKTEWSSRYAEQEFDAISGGQVKKA